MDEINPPEPPASFRLSIGEFLIAQSAWEPLWKTPLVVDGVGVAEVTGGGRGPTVRLPDPAFGLLLALALPTPTGEGPGDRWHEALCRAREAGDAVTWNAFADWCDDEGHARWAAIARAESERLGQKDGGEAAVQKTNCEGAER